MTNNYLKAFTESGDRYLAAVADAQEQLLKYMKLAADTSTTSAPFLFQPGVVPAFGDISTANFEFTEKLLKSNQAFVERLFATNPST